MRKMKIPLKELKEVLTRELKLDSPVFARENVGGKISGSVVSDTFSARDNFQRQEEIWDALEREYGSEAVMLVGTLLAYTQTEWNA